MILRSGLHCAAVFALAAFAAYAPKNGIRFMQSLIIISSVTVLALVVAGIFFPTYKGLHKNILIDPGIPILVAVITMATITIVSVRKTATDFTQVLATNETELRET